MKGTVAVLACALSAVLLWGVTNTIAQKTAKKEAIVWPADDLKWLDMRDGPPGILYADLWGHLEKGAYGALLKLPAGMKNPLHMHSSDIKLVVLSGTFLYTPEDGAEQRLGPGSYLFEPGGTRHLSGTGDDGPCEVFQESSGKFDFVAAEPPK